MSKLYIAQAISERCGYATDAVVKVLDAYSEVVTEALRASGKAKLPGVGLLKVFSRAARTGRNPRTGESVLVPPCKGVRIRAGTKLKKALAE